MAGTRRTVNAAADGCYEATRAAALSGVPKTTVYWWANHGVVVPSVSPLRERLWSYSDLIALRIVSWLRHSKLPQNGAPLPATPMPQVRKALMLLDQLGLDLWERSDGDRSLLFVDATGELFVCAGDEVLNTNGQPTLLPARVLDLTAPFEEAGAKGPDLVRPRPHLRIVPSKVAGEPHIENSRVTTQTVAALSARGYSVLQIADMYNVQEAAVHEGIELERQLVAAAVAA